MPENCATQDSCQSPKKWYQSRNASAVSIDLIVESKVSIFIADMLLRLAVIVV